MLTLTSEQIDEIVTSNNSLDGSDYLLVHLETGRIGEEIATQPPRVRAAHGIPA